ncbi:MAG: 2-oxoglutarate dehydrogenase E1 component [Myxococcales bacterium]|nr:2-oxoglutarate dehydrogenase E1 component [Myxococcales bacterium]
MDFGVNQAIVEELYQRYRDNPLAVAESWRRYFDAMPVAARDALLGAQPPRRPTVEETLVGMPAPAAAPPVGVPRAVASVAVPPPAAVPAAAVPGRPQPPATRIEVRGNGAGLAPPAPSLGGGLDGGLGGGLGGNGARPSSINDFLATASGRFSTPPSADIWNEYQERVTALVQGYRMRGHRFAAIDPLGLRRADPAELSLERFGLADVDPDTLFATGNLAGPPKLPLKEIVRRLKETYTRSIGVEYRNLEEPEIRSWLQEQMEPTCNRVEMNHDQQVRILSKLIDAELFEQFLHTKYVGAKRFSLEGTESVIPLLELVVNAAGRHGIEELVIGMAHRGRLNVLANVMEKSLEEIFAAFEDDNPEALLGRGDVKYHLGYSSDRVTPSGNSVHLTLSFNPSHLEFVNPVVEGRVRAKQDRRGDRERRAVLPILIHGDAAVIGQGIVQETINLSALRGYSTGGTVHVVVNNQIGFTTVWQDSRSTRYCTDIFRMLRCPIFHVNGEDPEAVAQVVKLAMEYRQRYGRDVVIDLYGYRRYGHNEADEPRFTQPVMYAAIDQKTSVREVYVQRLIELGAFTEEQARQLEKVRRERLDQALEQTREKRLPPPNYAMQGLWAGYRGGRDADTEQASTAVSLERLKFLLTRATSVPEDFSVHPKLERLLEMRRDMRDGRRPLDWGTAETLAYASLVTDGVSVRLSGQDARRGTFSHRHAVLHDHETGRLYTPLSYLTEDQARFEVWDSPLSEAGVLGFEYGYSLDSPDGLTIWEAQFGDFANGAQVIIDQFLSSSEDKWYRLSGLCLLLPHGFEGQGPEHSSARLERWLNLCAEDNMQVLNLTTGAQLFHALRRQVLRPYRKPLIIMSPKSLLRSPAAAVRLEDLAEGTFERIIGDVEVASGRVDPSAVTRVLLCSGKLYYELAAARAELGRFDVAILRIEQLYPLDSGLLAEVLAPYPQGCPLVWVQEEPWNMGAWYMMRARLPELLTERHPLRCIARPESASPATGSHAAHKIEQARLLESAFD